MIALKFPAYLVPHEHKTLWLLHQFRQAYDLGDVGQGLSDDGLAKARSRPRSARADEIAFGEAPGDLLQLAGHTRDRLRRYNDRKAQVLYPPLNDAQLFTGGGEPGGYVFAGGRVAPGKRQHLSWSRPWRGVRARPAASSSPDRRERARPYAERLRALVARARPRRPGVELRFGFHPRAEIAAWMNGAAVCAYLPFDEDSLGYVTMEAFAAGKPVLTTADSGGLLEMVSRRHGARLSNPRSSPSPRLWTPCCRTPRATAALGRAAKAEWEGGAGSTGPPPSRGCCHEADGR